MKKELKAYFSAFGKSNKSLNNTKHLYNTTIKYDDNCVEFMSDLGEELNLKFKNKIEKVLVINEGVIIKVDYTSANFEFFNKSKINSHQKYFYYLITNHPLNNISTLNLHSNDSILDINIVKTSIKFPFIISKNNNKYLFYLLLHKEQKSIQDFNNYLQRIMNNIDTNSDNFNLTASDSSFSLLYLSDFHYENGSLFEKIRIFTCFTEKNSIFFLLFEKNQSKLYIIHLKFKKNDSFSFIKTENCIKSVLNYNLIDSIISDKSDEELFENKKNFNKNIIINYLQNIHSYGVKNKTLVFLDSNFMLNFLESINIVLKVDITNYLNIHRNIKIKSFDIKKNTEFYLYVDTNNNNTKSYQFKLNFKINCEFLLNYLRYLQTLIPKEIITLIIKNMFEIGELTKSNNQFESFLDYLLIIFSIAYNYRINHEDIDMNESYINNFPLLTNINLDINNKKNKNTIFFTNNYSLIKGSINKEIGDYFTSNKDYLAASIVEFSRIHFENIKIQNFYCKKSHILLDFSLKLLEISGRNEIIYEFIQTIIYSYGDLFTYRIKINSFPGFYNNKTFLEYLKKLYTLKTSDEYSTYNYIYFKFMKNLIIILSSLRNNYLTNNLHLLNNEHFIKNDYTIYLRRIENENKIVFNNSLCAIINAGMDINNIKLMHPLISLIILEEIDKFKFNPYSILTSDKKFNKKLLMLVERDDLVRNIINEEQVNNDVLSIEGNNNIASLLYENHSSNYESDYYTTNIKFNSDSRFKEALRILNPNRVIKVNSTTLNSSDPSRIQIDKFNLMLKNLNRQYSTTIGHGAINLNTIKTFPKDILSIKSLNITCISSIDESTFKLDNNSELIKDKEFMAWPEFHNGVSHALKLSTEFFTNKSYIRNWILFNKPIVANFEHGGFLFGLGLLKQLDSLYSTDIYQYMKTAHDGITIGILLGRAASKISSMEESLSRTLCLHIAYLIPSTLEINIPMNIQCSASIGLGLLYLATGNRLMTEMLVNQIGRNFNFDKCMNISHIESYNLCLGFSVGLVNLGLGNVNEDLKLEEKLLNFANGGRKADCNQYNNKNKDANTGNSFFSQAFNSYSNFKKTSQTLVEEFEVNTKLTAPAAFSCLSLMYLQSENTGVSSKIKIPQNLYELEDFKPLHLYLAILTKNLITWENISASETWVEQQIPDYIKFLYEEKLVVISEDCSFSSKLNSVEFSHISACYYYSITAGIMSLGFKHAGSNNKEIMTIIIKFIKKLKKVRIVSDIIVKDQIKYDDTNKSFLNKSTLDQCMCICAYAIAIVMTGSGDLEAFKILRVLRKRLESDVKNFNYGYNQAIHHAIGILFLGSGCLTFTKSKETLALLYISIFPVFANSPQCNERYLQPLRHLYVLACFNKILETRDISSGCIVRTEIQIIYKDNSISEVITPVNIEDYSQIKIIKLKSKDYYYVQLNHLNQDDMFLLNTVGNYMKTKTIYIKKKNTIDGDVLKMMNYLPINNEFYSMNVINELKCRLKTNLNGKDNLYVLTNIILDRCEDGGDESSLMLCKHALILFIEYLKDDKLNSFLILNNLLIKLIIKDSDEEKENIYKIIFDLVEIIDSVEDRSLNQRLCMDQIKNIIMKDIKLKSKDKITNFFRRIFNKEDLEFSFEKNLTIFSLFNINLNYFNPHDGLIYMLLIEIWKFMNKYKVDKYDMYDLVINSFKPAINNNNILGSDKISLDDLSLKILYSCSFINKNCMTYGYFQEFIIYLIELFIEIKF